MEEMKQKSDIICVPPSLSLSRIHTRIPWQAFKVAPRGQHILYEAKVEIDTYSLTLSGMCIEERGPGPFPYGRAQSLPRLSNDIAAAEDSRNTICTVKAGSIGWRLYTRFAARFVMCSIEQEMQRKLFFPCSMCVLSSLHYPPSESVWQHVSVRL